MSKAISLTPTNSPQRIDMTVAMWAGGGSVPTVWVAPTGGNTVSVTAYVGGVPVVWTPGTVGVNTTYALTSRCDYLVFTLVSGTDVNTTCGVVGN